MLQSTACRRIKPYLHLFSPGARASEKGMLYRNGTMNAWARVAPIPRIQQTPSESSQYNIACLSIFYPVLIGISATLFFMLLLTWEAQPFSSNMSKDRWIHGTYSEHEKFIRNSEMGEIIAMHAEAIANVRKEIERPEVFTAPNGYRGVVLDTGSCFTKVGYSGEEAPRSIFHSCVGATRRGGVDATLLQYPSDIVAGDAAYRNRGLFHLCHPIQHAELVDPHTFEQLLFYTLYHELRVPPEESAVLMLEPVNVSRQQREKVAEAMFESLNVPLLALLNTSSATLYSTGQTSGVVIDSGAGKTMINAVTHGYPLAFAMQLSHMAGDYLTDQLFANLRAKGYPFSTRADWHLAEQIKEHRCRAALDLPQELSALMGRDDMPSSNAYDLPDKERVFLFENEVTIAECLFDVGMARAMRRQDDKCSENEKDGAKAVTPQRGGSLSLSATATTANHTAQEAQSKSLTTYGFVASGRNAAALRDVDASLRPIDTTGYAAPNPSCGTPLYGWAEAVSAIIAASPAHLRTELYGSVVLGGGTTLMRDVDRRLQQELVRQVTQQRPVEQLLGAWSTEQPVRSMETLEKLRKSNLTSSSLLTAGSPVCAMDASMIRVIAHASRHYAAWIGGSIWSSLSVYPQSGISVAEYHECGPQAVHQYAL